MATLRVLRSRVASIRSIQRVTRGLRLVAAARMRRQQVALAAARPYAHELEGLLRKLAATRAAQAQPLAAVREPVQRVLAAVVTADRGLCGGLNAAICRRALGLLAEHHDGGVEYIAVGRKGEIWLRRRGHEPAAAYPGASQRLRFAQAVTIAGELRRRFLAGQADRVYVVYSEARPPSQQVPVVQQLLPIALPADRTTPAALGDTILESSPGRLFAAAAGRYLSACVWRALLHVSVCEQAARMLAMDNASKNAEELITTLTREINRERQAAITLQLMDIVGGASAVER